jgi:hypothetical protein
MYTCIVTEEGYIWTGGSSSRNPWLDALSFDAKQVLAYLSKRQKETNHYNISYPIFNDGGLISTPEATKEVIVA